MKAAFWKGKKVFLTGHTGFKGSWLSLWLQHVGTAVTGYALDPPTKPDLFTDASVAVGMRSIIGDIRREAEVRAAMEAAGPEVVLHLAAQTVVRTSYDLPAETYETNVVGTARVLDAVRTTPSVRVVVVVTSDKCYENREWLKPYGEEEALGGHDPYSSSKACQELVTLAYRRSFFSADAVPPRRLGIASARAGNVLGGGDWTKDQLVPDVMRSFLESRAVQIRRPDATRPWQFVMEPLNGYLMLAERLWSDPESFSESWNFGPSADDTKPVGWIVSELQRRWGATARAVLDTGIHPHEAGRLELDSTKARSRIGWKPSLSLAETLDWVTEWYRAFGERGNMRDLTLRQIERFSERSA